MYYQNKHHTIRSNDRGFTIVELLIIIITIGALVGLIYSTVMDIGRRRRNSERQQEIKTIQRAVEDYYSQKERYPSLEQINDAAWRNKNLKSLTDDVITDPSNDKAQLAATPTSYAYSYAPTTTDGQSCNNTTHDCMRYVLTATQEDAEIYTKNNYN